MTIAFNRMAAVIRRGSNGRTQSSKKNVMPSDDATLAAMMAELAREIDRSRRYERSFVLVRFKPPIRRESRLDVEGCLRVTDQTWTIGRDIWVFLPETREDELIQLFQRLYYEAPWVLMHPTSIAVFPDSALTLEGLIEAASDRVDLVVLDAVADR